MGILSAALAIGSIVTGNQQKKNKQGQRAALARITKIRNAQQKRGFKNQFRFAQADTISRGASREGGLSSSRSQGTIASNTSQFGLGLTEADAQERFGKELGRLQKDSDGLAFQAGVFSAASQFVGSASGQTFLKKIGVPKGVL